MSTRPRAYSYGAATGSRDLYRVQRVQRFLIWLLVTFVLALVALIPSAIASLVLGLPFGFGVFGVCGLISIIIAATVSSWLYIIPEFERVVVLKMGEFEGVRGPGRFWIVPVPPYNQSAAAKLDTRVHTRIITAAETLTSDNVPVGCEAVIFWRVEDPKRAALQVQNYAEAVFQAANSALKDTIGTLELSDLLGERDKVAQNLKHIIDAAAASFGVDVSSVEITDVRVPADLIQELSVLAQSRRAAQAKIAEAEAEKTIALKLQEASESMGSQAMEMYRLNVLERIGREEGSQIVVYGLGRSNPHMEQTITAASAGALIGQRPQKEPAPPPTK